MEKIYGSEMILNCILVEPFAVWRWIYVRFHLQVNGKYVAVGSFSTEEADTTVSLLALRRYTNICINVLYNIQVLCEASVWNSIFM